MAPLHSDSEYPRLRAKIDQAYRMDETECVDLLLPEAKLSDKAKIAVHELAKQLVITMKEEKKKLGWIDQFLHHYDLSTEEGIALMSLAEALLRIPDNDTIDKLIADKISTAEWSEHLSFHNSLMMNAATWSLLITGKIFSPTIENKKNLFHSLKKLVARLGIPVLRPIILQSMKIVGKQFVMGETIEAALARAEPLEEFGYRFSYDMLGEAARTAEDAEHYFHLYLQAMVAIGAACKTRNPEENPGISIKLSALHPRYDYTQRERVIQELIPRLLLLVQEARHYQIGVTIDAEESDRLDLSLDIFERIFTDPSMEGWEGLGLAVQAYQKRAFAVLDWIIALAKNHRRRIMVRLVKGAYWDTEIKQTQVLGLADYPVFTRKYSTDVSYLACVKKMLAHRQFLFPQFGTHNAYCVADIIELAGTQTHFEFQCLHGMGRPLYDQIVSKEGFHIPCRVYAPVGTHKDLLAYLVRRLLENGANTSFIHQLSDNDTPIEKIIEDPIAHTAALINKPHPKIPLPKYIYKAWLNSQGIDLSNPMNMDQLNKEMHRAEKRNWVANSLIDGRNVIHSEAKPVASPSDAHFIIGHVSSALASDVDVAFHSAAHAQPEWGHRPVEERAKILERAAELFQEHMPELIALIVREGARTIPDSISEVREAIDFCRYYAMRARKDFTPEHLPGSTGEYNQLTLHPRGVIASISPWNFPLAIFTGQIVAALVTGNAVVAKPAEQTPIVAYEAVRLLHKAGVPSSVLQLLIGPGETIGARMVADPHLAGVIFTGSTEVAKLIQQTLAHRSGPIIPLIAETGGQNAMIVDSSALPEQTVIDIVQSAFNSAGQRCSALRVLFVQEEIADTLIAMLKGYMAELIVGDPSLLSTDIGPVIDLDAKQQLQKHIDVMMKEATLLYQLPIENTASNNYFSPTVFEIKNLDLLKREVFGPILHVIRYASRDIDQVLAAIASTQYGLTGGIQSRIEVSVDYLASKLPVGNIYVNRNMIGAVVGVQPFGGEFLSGTGPKAGGPYYLPRLCIERSISINTTAAGGNASLVSMQEE